MNGVDADFLQLSLAAFELQLCQMLDSICAMEADDVEFAELDESPLEELPVDRDRITTLARELAALLEANNMAALGVWEQLKPLLAGENRDKLDAAISSLNFRNAVSILSS
jgi:hypothetical protein